MRKKIEPKAEQLELAHQVDSLLTTAGNEPRKRPSETKLLVKPRTSRDSMDNNILYRLTKVGTERQVASFSFASASDSKIFEISCTLQYNGVLHCHVRCAA